MVTEDSASVFLQNLLLRKRTKMAESIPLANAKTKEVQGLERLRDAYMKQQGLGDPEEVTDNLFESIRNAIVIECQLSLLEAEVDTISEAIGADVSAARPHRFKATKFALPTTCQFCQGKVFGLGGLVCQPCGFICHAKCEPKVSTRLGETRSERWRDSLQLFVCYRRRCLRLVELLLPRSRTFRTWRSAHRSFAPRLHAALAPQQQPLQKEERQGHQRHRQLRYDAAYRLLLRQHLLQEQVVEPLPRRHPAG